MRLQSRDPAFAAAFLLFVALPACGGDDRPAYAPKASEIPCEEPESEFSTGPFRRAGVMSEVDYWACTRPTNRGGDFVIESLEGTEATVTGSTAEIEIEWSGPDSIAGHNLLFWIGSNTTTVAPNGVMRAPSRGYYRWVIPENDNPLRLEFEIDAEAAGGDYPLNFAIDEREGDPIEPRISATATAPLYVIEVGSGDIQINLNWRTLVDLDLWVTDPDGFKIYYADLMSPSGGELDLDSYPACNFVGDRGRGNENVFWPLGSAPAGRYTVEADMFADCGTYANDVATEYRVTIVHGGDISSYEGVFEPGARESGLDTDVVATFEYP